MQYYLFANLLIGAAVVELFCVMSCNHFGCCRVDDEVVDCVLHMLWASLLAVAV